MSIESGINNKNISIHYRDRDEFIEEFLRKKGYKNDSFISSPKLIYPIRQRWNYLYNLNKLYKSKLQDKRAQQRLLTEEKEMKECTFIPHLNKNLSFIIKTNNSKQNFNDNDNDKILNTKENENKSFLNLNLIERQNAWIKKKKSDLKEKIKKQQKEQMVECFFTPEINNENAIDKAKMKIKTITLLEDPESYSMYIKRLQKKREQIEKDKKIESLRPGNGNIWKKKYSGNSKNKSYDYMKNEYSGALTVSKSNKDKINNKKYNNLFNNYSYMNTEYSIGNFSKRVKNGEFDKNKLYEDLYTKSINKLSDPYGRVENDNFKNNVIEYVEQESIYNQPIEYGKAIDILHNKLYSINLDNDQDEEYNF